MVTNLVLLPIGIVAYGGAAFLLGLFFRLSPSDPEKGEAVSNGAAVPTFTLADEEALALIATRARAELAKGTYYRFPESALAVYGEDQLSTLGRALLNDRHLELITVRDAICKKMGWSAVKGGARPFLEAFYAQLRERLAGSG